MEGEGPIFLTLDLEQFKVARCRNMCKSKKCSSWHSWHDSRRPWVRLRYSKYPCEAAQCKDKSCLFSHNIIEQKYHPDNYKKKYCQEFIELEECKFGEVCALAHSDQDLKIRPLHLMSIDLDFFLFHFKSEFCPFGKIEHNRFTCVYAHNWQDFKRPFRDYSPEQCPHWSTDKTVVRYEDACPFGFACRMCHGWKERDYHPLRFKTAPCENKVCNRKHICCFKHSDASQVDQPLFRALNDSAEFSPTVKQIHYGKHNLKAFLGFIEAKLPIRDIPEDGSDECSPQREPCKDSCSIATEIKPLMVFQSPHATHASQKPQRRSMFEKSQAFLANRPVEQRRQSDNVVSFKQRFDSNRKIFESNFLSSSEE